MKYRGFDPGTRTLRWAAFCAVVAFVTFLTAGGAAEALGSWLTVEQGRLPWIAMRLLGLLAYLSIAGSVVYGLLLSTGILDALAHRTVSFALHQELAAIGIGLAMLHGSLLVLDRSVPFTVAEVLVPFAAPYRPAWVGAGQLALYAGIVVYASFSVRRWIGQRRWRALHWLTFLVFVGATAHGLMAGSDTSAPWAFAMYLAATAGVAFLTAYRAVLSIEKRRAKRGSASPGRPGGVRDQEAVLSGLEREGAQVARAGLAGRTVGERAGGEPTAAPSTVARSMVGPSSERT